MDTIIDSRGRWGRWKGVGGGRYTSDIPSLDISRIHITYQRAVTSHQALWRITRLGEDSRWLTSVYLCSRHAEELNQEGGPVESPSIDTGQVGGGMKGGGGRQVDERYSLHGYFPHTCLRPATSHNALWTNNTARGNSRWLPSVYLCSRHAEELDKEGGAVESPSIGLDTGQVGGGMKGGGGRQVNERYSLAGYFHNALWQITRRGEIQDGCQDVYLCSRHAEELDQESGAVESPVLLRNLG